MDGKHWLEDALREFRRLKRQAEKALSQVSDEEFFRALDPESNSLALLVKRLAGNLRWMTSSPPTARSPTAIAIRSLLLTPPTLAPR